MAEITFNINDLKEGPPQIDDRILDAVKQVESGGGRNLRSPKGAIGPYQFMPATYQSYGLTEAQAMDDATARPVARKELQRLANKYGSLEHAFAAYNWGEGNLDRQGFGKAPAETKSYLGKLNDILNPKKEEVTFKLGDLPRDGKTSSERAPGSLGQFAQSQLGYGAQWADMFADFVVAQPLGVAADAMRRIGGIAMGEPHKLTSMNARAAAETVQDTLGHPFSKAVQGVMHLFGYEPGTYGQSAVDSVMGKVKQYQDKLGGWVEEQSKGALNKEDVDSLVDTAMVSAVGRGAIASSAKAKAEIGKSQFKPPSEERVVREDPEPNPKPAAPTESPQAMAKRHIEESTGIKDTEEALANRTKRRAEARAAFAADPEYADYLKVYADSQAEIRTIDAERAEKASKAEAVETKLGKPQPEVSWNEALPIYKKPAFQRTAEDIIKLKRFERQGGRATPEFMVKLAALGLGATIGLQLDKDHPIEGFLLGMLGVGSGILLTQAGAKAIANTYRGLAQADGRIRIGDMGDAHESYIKQTARKVMQAQERIVQLVPDPNRRAAITNWVQGDKSIPLSEKEYRAAQFVKQYYDEMGKVAKDAGVIDNFIDNYVTQFWDLEGRNASVWEKLKGPSMSPESRFNLQRKIQSYAEGKKLGLTPITEDVAQIMGMYGNALGRTVANKQLIESLKNTKIDGAKDQFLMMPNAKAPDGYVMINDPVLMPYRVHPDIAPSMRFLFQQRTPSGVMAGLEAINTAAKRSTVSFSLFHAKSLLEAYVGAEGIKALNPAKIGRILNGTDSLLQQVKKGGAGDTVDLAQRAGLEFSLNPENLAVDDISRGFYQGLNSVTAMADRILPGSGKIVKAYKKINEVNDKFMWERLHAGLKLNVFSSKLEALKLANRKANARDPGVPIKSDLELAKVAASFTNDIFGGLSWRRIAEATESRLGRNMALEIMSPKGRRVMQLLMFAPDWTISTTRAMVKAFGKGTVKGSIPGMTPETLADLHRQYVVRSAIYYLTAANAINYALSGHYVWDNKDPTRVELGDGRTMQFSKHAMEPIHWITQPRQQALSKLSAPVSELGEQLLGAEYLSAYGSAPKMDQTIPGRLRHMGKKFLPIPIQGFDTKHPETALAGAAGFPIYGKTKEEKEEDKIKRRLERRKKKEQQ